MGTAPHSCAAARDRLPIVSQRLMHFKSTLTSFHFSCLVLKSRSRYWSFLTLSSVVGGQNLAIHSGLRTSMLRYCKYCYPPIFPMFVILLDAFTVYYTRSQCFPVTRGRPTANSVHTAIREQWRCFVRLSIQLPHQSCSSSGCSCWLSLAGNACVYKAA